MLGWLFRKAFWRSINAPKQIRVHGVPFKIRKLNVLDYMTGSKSVRQIYDTFSRKPELRSEMTPEQVRAIKEHYADVFLGAVVEPQLCREGEGPNPLPVAHLMTDWGFADELYTQIIAHTYGLKKKQIQSIFQKTAV